LNEDYREQKERQFAVQAEVLASSLTAALAFGDADATREYLSALRANQEILAAAAYSTDGKLVAQYGRANAPTGLLPRTAPPSGQHYADTTLSVSQRVVKDGTGLGTVFLVVETDSLLSQLTGAASLMFLAILGSILIAVPVSMRLNAALSNALRDVAGAAARVKAGDLNVDLPKSARSDEIGVLVSSFGQMLASLRDMMQQERLRALGQMASGVAHDINNALSPVALYTESLLEKKPAVDGDVRGYLETVRRVVHDVTATVARLRDFSRKRVTELVLAPMDLNQLVLQAVDLTRARWLNMQQERGIVIAMRTELAPDLPPAMGIEGEIREALTNLIFNAVDAMPKDGTLTVRTRTVRDESGPTHVVLEVSDTGTGMNEETRRRCFEPFYTTKGEQGTGLGLAMVYGVVQRHSAEIEIDSTPGEGTTFRITFVACAPVAADTRPEAAVAPRTALRVLVVDDDPFILDSMCDVLTLDGHDVVAAKGGQEAIEMFRSMAKTANAFATVITDLSMPYVDGTQVAKAVKDMSPATPIILLTGWGRRMSDDGEMPVNVDCVLAKPPKLADLRAALERWHWREVA
jgi:signal transduction histidine kinase/ActR/RegA family two-component response regulator